MIVVDGLYGSGMGLFAEHLSTLTGMPIWRPWTLLPANVSGPSDVGAAEDRVLTYLTATEISSFDPSLAGKRIVIVGSLLGAHAVKRNALSLRAWRLQIWWMSRQPLCFRFILIDTPLARIRAQLSAAGEPVPPDLEERAEALRGGFGQIGKFKAHKVGSWASLNKEKDLRW